MWQLNLNVDTDAWKDLQKVTGTKDKVCNSNKYVKNKHVALFFVHNLEYVFPEYKF